MDALQAAQSVYNSTIRNLANKELELDAITALQVATFCASLAQAEAAGRQAAAMERIVELLTRRQDLVEPDATGFHTEEEYNDALEDYHYRKAQAEAWAKAAPKGYPGE